MTSSSDRSPASGGAGGTETRSGLPAAASERGESAAGAGGGEAGPLPPRPARSWDGEGRSRSPVPAAAAICGRKQSGVRRGYTTNLSISLALNDLLTRNCYEELTSSRYG